VNRKIKFQEGGRTTPYNPMGHLTNPEEAEKRRVAGNKGRTPANKKGKYWWSEYTDPFTKPVDKFLSGALGPAAKPVQGLLSLGTPAEAVNKALDKPTAGNIIEAAADTAATAVGGKAILGPVKAVKKVGPAVKEIPSTRRKDMGKYSVAKSLYETGKKAVARRKKLLSNTTNPKVSPTPKPKEPPKTQTPKSPKTPKRVDETVQTNPNTGRAPDGGRGGATTPPPKTPKTPKTPKNPKNPKTPSKTPSLLQRAKKLVKPAVIGGTGVLVGSMLGSEKNATPAPGSQAGGTSVNTSPDGSNAGAGMDTDLFDTPTGVTGRKPTGTTGRKPKKDPTEGGKYKSYSKDNNDFMYMTQKGYDEEEEQGDKAGGRPGRGKMKTQGMNKTAKRKAGFSGKGSGAALRGF